MKRIEISISSLVKAIVIIVIGLLLVVQTPTFATTGKSTASNVRVRKTPSTESEVLDLLGVDDIVEILGKEGDWYKVSFKGTTGYVSQSFISTNEKNTNDNNSKLENNQKTEDDTNKDNNNSDNNDNSSNTESNLNNNEVNNEVSNETNNEVNNETNNQTTSTIRVYKMAETSKVNILPVVTAEQIGEVKKDEKVTLVINAKLWAYIKSENISGWVRIDKLSSEEVEVANNEENNVENNATEDDENSETEADNKEEKSEENNDKEEKEPELITFAPKTMYVRPNAINVRSASNTSADVVTSLNENTEVKVVGEQNGWYKVEVNGKNGFIRKDLLLNQKKEVTSRNNELDRNAAVQNNAQEQAAQPAESAQQATQEQPAATVSTTTESVPVSSSGVSGSDIAAYAQQFVGCRYVYGASGPSSFDCSGLTMYVYQHFGYSLSHSSRVQATQGVAVSGNLQPGDILVFSNDGRTVGHVGIYIGNDKFVHASDSKTGVIISNLSDRWNISKYWGARRIL